MVKSRTMFTIRGAKIVDHWIVTLVALFCLDRLVKAAAVIVFFRRPAPPQPDGWPSVTLLQPITRGVHDLAHNLEQRLRLDYRAPIQQLWICDRHDSASQSICQALRSRYPLADVALIDVAPEHGALASKIEKLRAALPYARGEVLCFVDDDVALRPAALRELIPYLGRPQAGAAFGLACYTNWRTCWSSLMSGFVNANALLSYVPVTYLTEPFTITGHCFAMRRPVFDAVGGLEGMASRIDDDHELARRLRRHGLRCIQTPTIYDVDNDLPTLAAYLAQMQRWFVLPRLLMAPYLAPREQALTTLGSAGTLLPSLIALLALWSRSRRALRWLTITYAVFAAVYLAGERRYLGRTTPPRRLAALAIVAVIAPLQIVWGLFAGDEVLWRGQRLRIRRGGAVEVLK
jgi:ceramide glucosyltransferase